MEYSNFCLQKILSNKKYFNYVFVIVILNKLPVIKQPPHQHHALMMRQCQRRGGVVMDMLVPTIAPITATGMEEMSVHPLVIIAKLSSAFTTTKSQDRALDRNQYVFVPAYIRGEKAELHTYHLKVLRSAEKRFPSLLHSARGLGTFCAFDCDTPER